MPLANTGKYGIMTAEAERNEVKMMKKLFCLLTLICCAAMSLTAAWASPLTGDTSNMDLWIGMVVAAVVILVVMIVIGAKKRKK